MAANFLKSRQGRYAAYATTYILVILAVLAAVNFLANRYDKSYDSTSNKQFSLSDQTIKFVGNLKNDIKVTYFDEASRFPQARDLLDRYTALSPKVKVEFIDPVKKPQQAKSAGYRRDVTILVDSGARKEEAKSLTEEEVTGAIIRSQKSGERNVCFVNAANERSIDDEAASGFSLMKQMLERDNYKTRTIDFKPKAAEPGKPVAIGQTPVAAAVEVPKDCLVLVIGGPQLAYPTPIVDAFKKYVEGGGHALFMLDNVLKIGRGEPTAENTELVQTAHGVGGHGEQRSRPRSQRHRQYVRRGSGNPHHFAIRTESYHAASHACAYGLPGAALAGDQVGRQEHGGEAVRHYGGQHRGHRGGGQRRNRPQEGEEGPVHAGRVCYHAGLAERALCRGGHFAVGRKSRDGFTHARQSRSVHEHDQLAQRR